MNHILISRVLEHIVIPFVNRSFAFESESGVIFARKMHGKKKEKDRSIIYLRKITIILFNTYVYIYYFINTLWLYYDFILYYFS